MAQKTHRQGHAEINPADPLTQDTPVRRPVRLGRHHGAADATAPGRSAHQFDVDP